MRLIPNEAKNTANYWCSWRNQRLFMSNPFFHLRLTDKAKHEACQRDMLSDAFLFGEPGVLAGDYMQGVRRDMIVMLDDGWDLPWRGDYTTPGSLILNERRFPYGGKTPAENLAILSRKVADLGYSGTGLWVPMTAQDETWQSLYTLDKFTEFWEERARWMAEAGIAYLKVDWGIHQHHVPYRAALTDVIHRLSPGTVVEHAVLDGWWFDPNADRTRLADVMRISDAFRCYDVKFEFNAVSTLARASTMLTLGVEMQEGCAGIVNAGEEPYLAAALGCAMGIMSHPLLRGSVITMLPDDFKNGITTQRLLKSDFHSFDHYERALRWHRIAPPMSYAAAPVLTSEEWLEDSWTYDKEPYPFPAHELRGKTCRQSAPAVVSRGCPLPEVTVEKRPSWDILHRPFTVASRHPESGAFAIATLPRTVDGVMNCTTPRVDIRASGLSPDHPFAVFGEYKTLTLVFDTDIEGYRLFGGDLLLDDQPELTGREGVTASGNTLTLDGELLSRLGTECASFHDLADPGSVFRLVKA